MQDAFAQQGLDPGILTQPGGFGLCLLEPGTGWQQQTGKTGQAGDAALTLEVRLADYLPEGGLPAGNGPDEAHALLTARADGETAAVWFGGEQVQLDHDGVSVVVVEPATGRLVQSISFDAADGYAP